MVVKVLASSHGIAAGVCACLAILVRLPSAPLLPVGVLIWYGIVLSVAVYVLDSWHCAGTSGVKKCSRTRSHLCLLSCFAASVICTIISLSQEQDQFFSQVVLLFVLPVVSTWDIGGAPHLAPFHIYLGTHFVMTFTHTLYVFPVHGWLLFLTSLVFDSMLMRFARTKNRHIRDHHEIRQLARALLENTCDGYCLVDNAGVILVSDLKMLMLVDSKSFSLHQQPLCGTAFSSLLAPRMDSKLVRPEVGVRPLKLRTQSNPRRDIDVEAFTQQCLFDREGIEAIVGPASRKTWPDDVYLCTFRNCENANGADRTQKKYTALSDVRASDFKKASHGFRSEGSGILRVESGNSGLGSDIGMRSSHSDFRHRKSSSNVGFGSDIGIGSVASGLRSRRGGSRHASEVCYNDSEIGFDDGDRDIDNCSCVSSVVAASRVGLEKTRLKLMERCSAQVVLEVDLPSEDGSNIGSSVVSETLHTPQNVRARMRFKRDRNRFPCSNTLSSESEFGISSVSEEEVVTSEVLDTSVGPDGKTRVRFGFTSQMLCEQQQEMDALRRDCNVMEELQKDSKAVLQNFQKIVNRHFSQVCEEGPPNIKVFICDECSNVRNDLMRNGQLLGYNCQAYDSVEAVREVLSEGAFDDCRDLVRVDRSQPRRPSWQASSPHGASSSALTAHLGPPARMVFIGESFLDRLPSEWHTERIFVVLVSSVDESSEEDKQEALRMSGVNQIMHRQGLSLETWRCMAQEALQWCFADEFLLTTFLGAGSNGAVHLAKRLRDGESFALKQVALSRRSPKVSRKSKNASREADFVARLRWPTVLYVFDAWWAEGRSYLYMLMPPMLGGDVEKYIKACVQGNYKIKPRLIADWYVQALDGLTYLHWCGVVHRDLKPGNILLDVGEQALRIGDFGAAMLVQAASSHPRRRNCVKAYVTTPSFTAKEVYDHSIYYSSSDMWSIGATFFEVLTLAPLVNVSPNQERVATPLVNTQPFDEAIGSLDFVTSNATLAAALLEQEIDEDLQRSLLEHMVGDVGQILDHDFLKRPMAADLMRRDCFRQWLERLSCETGPLVDPLKRQRRSEMLDEIIEQSIAAADLDPPDLCISPRAPSKQSRRPSMCSKASSSNSQKAARLPKDDAWTVRANNGLQRQQTDSVLFCNSVLREDFSRSSMEELAVEAKDDRGSAGATSPKAALSQAWGNNNLGRQTTI